MAWLETKKVLIVEDNDVDILLAKRLLEREWVHPENIYVVENGRAAVKIATGQLFDLILMDIQLPEIDGIDAATLIKLHYNGDSSPKIIAYTTYDKDHPIPWIEIMDGRIEKPSNNEIFRNEVRKNLQIPEQLSLS